MLDESYPAVCQRFESPLCFGLENLNVDRELNRQQQGVRKQGIKMKQREYFEVIIRTLSQSMTFIGKGEEIQKKKQGDLTRKETIIKAIQKKTGTVKMN